MKRLRLLALLVSAPVSVLLTGCASDGAGSGGMALPAALSARWTPPAFASRPVDGERDAVLAAAADAARSLGYSVSRYDRGAGRISAARRIGSAFDGVRQDVLELTATETAPGVVAVSLDLREVVEAGGSADERGALPPTSAIVRDRAPYDVFFGRLAAALAPAAP
jgi:hypothetical protein